MIYLDYQATTPLAPEARTAMLPWLDHYGNPSSPHRLGREAAAVVDVARDQVLAAIGDRCAAGRLAFTSGATEALNWAIKGVPLTRDRNRIVTVATEHAAVLDTVRRLADEGAEVIVLPVHADGIVDLDVAADAIDDRTALVAAMLVNNEIGTIGPVAALGALAHAAGATMLCDAVQALGRVPIPLDACDLVAVSAHKIHGPKGIGALWMRQGCVPAPLIDGGGQQGGLRSGTLAPMLCAGFGAAAALAGDRADVDAAHVRAFADRLRGLLGDDWTVNGSRATRYAGNLNCRHDGIDAGRLISELRNVAFSAGSACASGSGRPSHVLRAIGLSDAEARSSIRLGFGRYTTEAEIDEAAALINAAAERQLEWGMSVTVRFVSADGADVREVSAPAGERLLDVAQAAGQPLEGTCEGQMACSTCHVIVAPADFARLPAASEEEDDLLDLAAGVTRTSRLACQIWLEESLDGLTVRMPPEARDMQGR